jgi:hypothetical protein
MVGKRRVYPRWRSGGRFYGRRVNLERVPKLPAWILSRVLADPRTVPYLLLWRNDSCEIADTVRVERYHEPPSKALYEWSGCLEVKRPDGSLFVMRTVARTMPRNRAEVRLVICPFCQTPRRALYGWEPGGRYTTSAMPAPWRCRICNGLRYASEGGALAYGGRGALARMFAEYGGAKCARPDSWLPEIIESRERLADFGFRA